ncbi:MAG: alpha/beta hydrolase [Candidatus Woesearchaeota archaeon]
MVTVIYVGGGMTFPDHASFLDYLRMRELSLEQAPTWKDTLADDSGLLVVRVPMPCKENAHYDAWEITFSRYLELVEGDLVLVGCSLGGIFLAKYLSEHERIDRVGKVILVAPPFDDTLSSEPLTNGFVLGDLSRLAEYDVELFFSKNDTVVPVEHAEKYRSALPSADIHVLDAADHFIQEEFSELVGSLRSFLEDVR